MRRNVNRCVFNAMQPTGLVQFAARTKPEHRPQIHEAEVWRLMVDAEVRQFEIQELDIEIDVVSRDDAILRGGEEIPRNVLKSGSLGNVCVGDPMNLRGCHPPGGIDQRVEDQPGSFTGIDAHDGDFHDPVSTRSQTGGLKVDDRDRSLGNSSIMDSVLHRKTPAKSGSDSPRPIA